LAGRDGITYRYVQRLVDLAFSEPPDLVRRSCNADNR